MHSTKPIEKADHITILMPTRKRTAFLKRALDSLQEKTADKALIDLWLYVDHDDDETLDFINRGGLTPYAFKIHWIAGERTGSQGEMVNILWRKSTTGAGIYIPLPDDYRIVTSGWDRIVRETFARFSPRILLAYVDEPTGAPGQAVLFLLSAEWINRLGRIVTNYFSYWFDDTWLDEVSQMVGRRVKIDIRMEPQGGKGKTIRMRNLPFWHKFYIHTADERLHDAETLRRAIYPVNSDEYRRNRAMGERLAVHFRAKNSAVNRDEHLRRQEALYRAERGKVSRELETRYQVLEQNAQRLLLDKAKTSIRNGHPADALDLLETTCYADNQLPEAARLHQACMARQKGSMDMARDSTGLDRLIPPEIHNDPFYATILRLAAGEAVQTILEIGSSAGQGSTDAFVRGLACNPHKPVLHCLEVSRGRFKALQSLYAQNPQVHCHNASSVLLSQFPSEEELNHFYHQTPTALNKYPLERVQGWLRADRDYVAQSGVVQDGIRCIKCENHIDIFDMVLIDGSEFTGAAELDEVFGARFLLLDDIGSFKNYANYRRLKEDPEYELLEENLSVRNGYAVFKRRRPLLPIHFFTIVLNGMPFIEYHMAVFESLDVPWHWHIVEGVADLVGDTGWSKASGGRIGGEWHRNGLSIDGTTAYLDRLAKEYPERITIYRPPDGSFWQGKLAMVNAVLPNLPHECLLWQIDADELWTAAQIGRMHVMFTDHPERTAAFFHCHFFVAPNLVTITPETYSHHNAYEWLRVWRFQRGMHWHSHEPPKLMRPAGGGWRDLAECRPFRHHETEGAGLVFTHYAYALESQVRFKESYYGYAGAVAQWRLLQQVKKLPVRLSDYLNWVKDAACVDQPERAVIGRKVPPIAWPLERQKEARCPHVVIDGVIFQLQHRRPLGIARVWCNLLPALVRAMPNARFTLLVRRGYAPRADLKVPQSVVDAYQWGDEAALDRDDMVLADTCRALEADLFISTYFTRAPGYTNLVLVHDLIPELTGADLLQPEWRAKQRAIETGDLFAAVSKCTQNDLHRIYPHTRQRFQAVTGNGRAAIFGRQPEHRIDQFKKKYALSEPYLLMVGNRGGYKNGAALFEAMAEGRWDKCQQVVCVGGETRLTPLEKRMADCQLVRFLPYLEDEELAAAYGGAFALICLSAYEGFGMPLVEAMACGCPVISTGGGALREVGGDAIIYLEKNSAESIRSVLEHLRDPQTQGALTEKGFVQAACFSWESAAKRMAELIDTQFKIPRIKISAIASTFRGSRFLSGCLEDLQAQTIADRLEIIVIDSASPENEAQIVRKFQERYANIKYIRTLERESVYAAWNRGIKLAQGKYITNANTDDRHRRDAFEKMAAVLDAEPEVALVYADVIKTSTANETFERCTPTGLFAWHDWNRQTLLERGCFMGPQPMWRRQVHDVFGYFDETLTVAGDYEFWLRISQIFEFKRIPRPLGLYLERADSVEHAHAERKRQEEREVNALFRQAAQRGELLGFQPFLQLHRAVRQADEKSARDILQQVSDLGQGLSGACAERIDTAGRRLAGQLKGQGALTNELADYMSLVGRCFLSRGRTPITAPIAGEHEPMDAAANAAPNQGGLQMKFADQVYNIIQMLLERDQREIAHWILRKLLTDFPDHAAANHDCAIQAYAAGDMKRAAQYFRRAAELAPGNADFQTSLGDFLHVVQSDPDAAIAQYRKVLALRPRDLATCLTIAHLNVSARRFDEAVEDYRKVLELDPYHGEARACLEKLNALKARRSSPAELHMQVQKARTSGDKQTAVRLLSQIIAQDPDDAVAHNDLGVLYFETGRKDLSQFHYEKAAELAPENSTFLKNLADFYFAERGDAEKALGKYVQALTLDPQDVEALMATGHICVALERLDDARVFFERVLQIEPWHSDASSLMSQMDVLPSFPPARLPAGNYHNLYDSAQAQAAGGDPRGAIRTLEQLIGREPHHAPAFNDLGVLHYELGDKEQALRYYEQAAKLNPGNPTFMKNLADFYYVEQGRIEEALRIYVHILESDREDVDCLMAAGTICAGLNRTDDARTFYERVLEIEPWHHQAREALTGLGANGRDGNETAVIDFRRKMAS